MKKLIYLTFVAVALFLYSCSKDKESERFTLLTTPVWTTESITATGADTTGVGVLIKLIRGDAKFNTDGTGTFGMFSGKWSLNSDEDQITITTLALPSSIVADILTLTNQSLKLSADITIATHPQDLINLVLSFKVK